MTGGVTSLALASIDSTGEGAAVLDGARRILETLGTPEVQELTLAVVRKVRAEEEAKGLSSAGKALPAAAGDDTALAGFLSHVIEVTGGEAHPSGEAAVTEASLKAFLTQSADWLAWSDAPDGDPAILPLSTTAEALAAHDAVTAKLQQYFLLCDAVHLDADLASRAWIDATSTDLLDPVAATALLERAPLARPRADGVLDPSSGLNPAWRARIQAWLDQTVRAVGENTSRIDRATVSAVGSKLSPYAAWQASKPGSKAGDRGADALRAHLADDTLPVRVRELLARSEVAAVALDGVKLVEQTLLYQAWLLPLVNTMVSMPDLFSSDVNAWVERGKLVMDGRVFELAIKVNDAGRAERFAAMSPLYTLFVKVGDKGGALTEELMIPVTAGGREHLTEGMWGVFFDVDGKEQHAQIRKMISNPILH